MGEGEAEAEAEAETEGGDACIEIEVGWVGIIFEDETDARDDEIPASSLLLSFPFPPPSDPKPEPELELATTFLIRTYGSDD